MRRASFRDETVDYAAVGATQASDLMQYPPHGSRPAEESWRLGSGEERFRTAGESLLSWQALKAGGLTMSEVRPASAPGYSGVSFDEDGKPIVPPSLMAEQRFDADGTPLVSAGSSVRVHGRLGGLKVDADLRVIFAVEEARRIGFALGTVGDSVVSGEESFMVTWLPNDEVWFTVRAFDTPAAWIYKAVPKLVQRRRNELFKRYLRAMSPLWVSPA